MIRWWFGAGRFVASVLCGLSLVLPLSSCKEFGGSEKRYVVLDLKGVEDFPKTVQNTGPVTGGIDALRTIASFIAFAWPILAFAWFLTGRGTGMRLVTEPLLMLVTVVWLSWLLFMEKPESGAYCAASALLLSLLVWVVEFVPYRAAQPVAGADRARSR